TNSYAHGRTSKSLAGFKTFKIAGTYMGHWLRPLPVEPGCIPRIQKVQWEQTQTRQQRQATQKTLDSPNLVLMLRKLGILT
ncbi:hypothetical protein, partial [Corynebacterium matruchotii]